MFTCAELTLLQKSKGTKIQNTFILAFIGSQLPIFYMKVNSTCVRFHEKMSYHIGSILTT
jgi:hypothetical protein